jgi:hypothetical protein
LREVKGVRNRKAPSLEATSPPVLAPSWYLRHRSDPKKR